MVHRMENSICVIASDSNALQHDVFPAPLGLSRISTTVMVSFCV
jgi:hypothetical protein